MASLLLWVGQSLAVALLVCLASRLGARHVRPAAHHLAWQSALVCLAVLALAGFAPADPPASVWGATATPLPPSRSLAPLAIPAAPGWVLPVVVAIWMSGALWRLAGLAWQLARVRRLKRSCVVMTGHDLRRASNLRRAVRAGRRARLCWCEELAGPAMLGFGRPIVALPRTQADRLTARDLEQVLLHELAHVHRRDDWSALAEHVLVALMWINPAAHVVSRGLAVSREMSCDDWVIRQTAEPIAYARCLTAVAALRARPHDESLVAGVAASRHALRRRVQQAAEVGIRPGARLTRAAFGLVPLATGMLGVAILAMPPLVVEGPTPVGNPDISVTARPEATPAQAGGGRPAAADATALARQQAAGGVPGRVGAMRPSGLRTPPRSPGLASAPLSTSTPAAETRGAGLPGASPDASGVRRVELTPVETHATGRAPFEPALPPPPSRGSADGMLLQAGAGDSVPLVKIDPSRPRAWSVTSATAGSLVDGAVYTGRSTAAFFKRVGGVLSRPFGR